MSFSGKCSCQNHAGEDVIAGADTEQLEKRRELLQHLTDSKNKNQGNEWIPAHRKEKTNAEALFNKIAPEKILPSQFNFLANLCDWIGDKNSAGRLLNTMAPYCYAKSIDKQSEKFIIRLFQIFQRDLKDGEKFLRSLENLKNTYIDKLKIRPDELFGFPEKYQEYHRLLDQLHLQRKERESYCFNEIIELFSQTPPETIEKFGIKKPRRLKHVSNYIYRHYPEIEKLYNKINYKIDPLHFYNAKILAIISMLDGSSAKLPENVFQINEENDNFNIFIKELISFSSHPKYESLLATINFLNPNRLIEFNQTYALNLLDKNTDPKSIAWLYNRFGSKKIPSLFASQFLSPEAPKKIVELFEMLNVSISQNEIEFMMEQTAKNGDIWFLEVFCNWMDKIPKRYWSDAQAKRAWNTLLSGLALNLLQKQKMSFIYQWARPPKVNMPEIIPGYFTDVTKANLKRVIFYQKIVNNKDSFPGSLSKLFKLLDNDRSLDLQQHNLKIERKIQRKAEEVASSLALDALNLLVEKELDEVFKNEFHCNKPKWIKLHEIIDIIRWSMGLSGKAKIIYQEILAIWQQHGTHYKKHLGLNLKWLESVQQTDINTGIWLSENEGFIEWDGIKLRISFTSVPFRVFLMGSYFDTCLSIKSSGGNRESVITNAYDANKQVIFVTDEEGRVIARKLLVITSNLKIAAFKTYINNKTEDIKYDILEAEIDKYCAELAESLNLSFTLFGKPDNICGLYWYDDGIVPVNNNYDEEITHYIENNKHNNKIENYVHDELAKAARKYKDDWTALLDRIGLWPADEGADIGLILQKCPALVEEILAFVAREKNDKQLASLLCEFSTTNSGRMESNLADMVINSKYPDNIDWDINLPEFIDRNRFYSTILDIKPELMFEFVAKETLKDTHGVFGMPTLFSLLYKSEKFARFLRLFLISEELWFTYNYYVYIILHLVKLRTGSRDDRLVQKVFTHRNYDDTHEKYAPERLFLAQCLNVLEKPQKVMSYDVLRDCYYDKELSGFAHEFIRDNQIGVIIWAVRNQCNIAVRFLKDCSETDPAALLAIAILKPGRFKEHIAKTAVKHTSSVAAILALLLALGKENSKKLLDNTRCFDKPQNLEKFENLCKLHKVAENPVLDIIQEYHNYFEPADQKELLPFVVPLMHEAIINPPTGRYSNLPARKWEWICAESWIYILSGQLRYIENNENLNALKAYINHLINANSHKFELYRYEHLLWLNLISNDRLINDFEEWFTKISIHSSCSYALTHELFIDKNKNLRFTSNLEWKDDKSDLFLDLPNDLDLARIYAGFLATKVNPDEIDAPNEIHRRLFKKAKERLEGNDK